MGPDLIRHTPRIAARRPLRPGRDSSSAVTPACEAPFEFTGGTIDKVVVDLSGERHIDHEAEVRAWFAIDRAPGRD